MTKLVAPTSDGTAIGNLRATLEAHGRREDNDIAIHITAETGLTFGDLREFLDRLDH